ncbi:MAG: radical SAM protein [Kiritimatiellae bacterium]|nr:radical SAM protein [Kiritimatiellia bacterium]
MVCVVPTCGNSARGRTGQTALPGNKTDEETKTIMTVRFPHSVDFIITARCNLFCKVCWGWEMPPYRPLSTEERAGLFDRLLPYNIDQIVFTGGEPLLDDALPALLAHAHQNFRTFLFTNTMLFPDMHAALLPHVDRLSFSLDGDTAELNAAARAPGHFEKVLESIRIIRDSPHRPRLQILTVVTRQNHCHLQGIGGLLLERCGGILSRWKLNFCRDMGRYHKEFALPYDTFAEAAEDTKAAFRGRLRIRYSLNQHDDAYLFAFPDGNLYTPEGRAYRPVGNILDPRTYDAAKLSTIAEKIEQRDRLLAEQEQR